MILGIDTSSALTSVALVDGDQVVAARMHLDARRHAEVLAPLLAEVVAAMPPGGVTAVACGVGPGPYTGLRVGIATALAVGAAWEVPVHGLCSLDAVAAATRVAEPDLADFGVALDARRSEVYWARYGADGARTDGPRVGAAALIDPLLRFGTWAGHGAALDPDLFGRVVTAGDSSPIAYPHAEWVARRVAGLLASGAAPASTPDDASGLPLDAHGDDSGATAQALHGAALLPPRPLYLRRPDAVASAR